MAMSAHADSPGLAPPPKNVTKLVVATSLGNALEWFDISVYAYFAVYLSKAFFPTNDPTTSLLLTFATFAQIGVAAPLLVILARLVQGFSAGGEFGSSTAFLVEHMPGRRGFVASWQFARQGISALLGSGFGLLLSSTMSDADLQAWGWRIPFFFGVLIGPIGLYIRSNIEDATAPPAAKDDTPVRNVFIEQK